jgi:hypothetical protein
LSPLPSVRRRHHRFDEQRLLTMSSPPQVISRMPRCSLSTRFPRCTSSCSTASLAPFTARLSGTFVRQAGTATFASKATWAAEMNLGRTSAPAKTLQSIPRPSH